MEPYFDHERLEVYQLARHFNRQVALILSDIPRGHADSRNELKRSAKSITRNIAEGGGKWRLKDKANFYHIARGSATESAATLDELVDYGLVSEDHVVEAKRVLARVVAMLRSLERRQGVDMSE